MTSKSVKSITFENYKAFNQKQVLELKPITLLFGYNNSGKSSALRLIPLLSASFSSLLPLTYTKNHLNYAAECLRGATFSDITHGSDNKLTLGIQWEDGMSIECEIKQSGLDPETFAYYETSVTDSNGVITKTRFVPSASDSIPGVTTYEEENNNSLIVNFKGLLINTANPDEKKQFEALLRRQQEFSQAVFWLGSLRTHPPREFEIGAGIPVGIKNDGQGTAQTLWHLAETGHKAFEQVNEWLAKTCGRKIDISTSVTNAISNGRRRVKLETISILPTNATGSIRVPILDSGEGIAQALPVVTLCAQAAHGSLGECPILAIEQPELHLHPKATVDLANFLVDCIKHNNNVRFIIETHSESMLLALQTAIVKQSIKKEDVGCYWIQQNKKTPGSSIKRIEIDQDGFISENWPDEVFGETVEQSLELIELRSNPQNAITKDK